jgi:chorismate-pyruvate lyase
VTVAGPSPLPRLLRDNQDSVTHLLERLTGEPLVADVIRQDSRPAEADNALGLSAGQPLTHRIAVLKGGVTLTPFVYAESAFVPARLPVAACHQLERTSDPIGRVLAAHGLALHREDLPSSGSSAPRTPRVLDAAATGVSDVVWSRAYRLTMDALPVFVISEWFLRPLQDALERPMPG